MRIRRLMTAAIVCAAFHALPGAAVAQSMSTSMTYMSASDGRPQISASDIQVFVRVLELGDAEREVLEAVYEDYRAGIDRDYDEVRYRVEDIVEEAMVRNDRRIAERARPIADEWRKEKAERERVFLDDLTVLLTDEQSSRWPLVERELRRIKGMQGALSGEGVDLIKLAQAHIGPDAIGSAGLADLLERYSVELDAALKDRMAYRQDHYEEYQELRDEDPDRAETLWLRMREKRAAVRALNQRTVRSITARLRAFAGAYDPTAAAFEREWQSAALSWRADPTPAMNRLDEALKLTDLDTAQRTELEAMKERVDRERAVIHRDLIAAIFEFEVQPIGDMADANSVSSQDDDFTGYEKGTPMARVTERAQELDRAVVRTLRNTLTDEQRRAIRTGGSVYTIFRKDGQYTRF